jgi:nitrate reductase gamma subunit
MGFYFSLIIVIVLALLAWIGANIGGLKVVLAIFLPYLALGVFVFGIIYRIFKWAKSPVPFRITTTCGQQESLDFIKQNKLDNPSTGFQAFLRMFLEVLLFRSLFRNTKADLKDGEKLVYGSSKWLWLFSLMFHWSMLIIVLRHFRFFTEPVPSFVLFIQQLDGFFQIGLPIINITSIAIVIGLGYLLLRRVFDGKVKYISLPSDYFPLLLLLGIALSGIWMRHIDKVNLINIKQLTLGILSFQPVLPQGLEASFFIHFFFVMVLLIYFPMSKLVHLSGIFFSPTRNLANNNRKVRHINPWNNELKMQHHTYREYEEEFYDVMVGVGLPLDKEVDDVSKN